MLISVKKRFVFVANTKTASTSIEKVLAPHCDYRHGGNPQRKHLPLSLAETEIPQIFGNPATPFDSFFRFGVMRDPVDWIASWFRYRRSRKVLSPIPADLSFREFWQQADWNIRRGGGRKHLQRQKFLAQDGTLLADVILPYHDLSKGFAQVCEALGLDAPNLPHANRSAQPPSEHGDIPADLLDEVRDFYAKDYALFERLDEINAAGFKRARLPND